MFRLLAPPLPRCLRRASDLCAMLLLPIALAGCATRAAQDNGPPTPAAQATTILAVPLPSATATGSSDAIEREVSAAATQAAGLRVWQPPQPAKRVMLPSPTPMAQSADVLLLYAVAGLGGGAELKVTPDGTVVLGGYQGTSTTYKLSPSEFDRLKQQVTATDFFNLADRYWQEDPAGVIAEISIVTITYNEGGRSKSVALRGSSKTPPAVRELETTLENLNEQVAKQGTQTTKPDPLLSYYLQGDDYTWRLDIDVEGNLYYGNGPANAKLSPEDRTAVRELIKNIGFIGSDEWYTAPNGIRDKIYMSERRAILTTYKQGEQFQWINALSGATVPKELQALLEKLAQLDDQYAPSVK